MKGSVFIEKRVLPPTERRSKELVKYYVISRVDGRRQSHGGYTNKDNARARRREIEQQLVNNTFGEEPVENPLFDDFYGEWIAGKKIQSATMRAYKGSFERYILPFFRKKRLASISPSDVQEFINSLDHLSPGYARTVYSHLRSLLSTAVERDIIPRTPCRGLDLPKIDNGKCLQYLEPKDIQAFLDATSDPRYRTLFGILAFTGCRVGECLALRVSDIDFERREIRIERKWDINTREFSPPKTSAGSRRVDMLESLVELLEEHFRIMGHGSRNRLLFPSPEDATKPLSYQTVHSVFTRGLKKTGLPKVKIHGLRHSWTSIMLKSGAQVASISRNLGHSSPYITWRVYSHEVKSGLGEALEKADRLFRGEGKSDVIDLIGQKRVQK